MSKISFLQGSLQRRQAMLVRQLKAADVDAYHPMTEKANFEQGILVADNMVTLTGKPLKEGGVVAIGELYSYGPFLGIVKLVRVERIQTSLNGVARITFDPKKVHTTKVQG